MGAGGVSRQPLRLAPSFSMRALLLLGFRLALADLVQLPVLDVQFLDIEPTLSDLLEAHELGFLGPLIQIGPIPYLIDFFIKSTLGSLELFGGLILGFPGLFLELVVERFRLRLSTSSRRCAALFFRRPTNDSSPASTSTQLSTNGTLSNSRPSIFLSPHPEELFADEVEIGDGDDVDFARGRCRRFVFLFLRVFLVGVFLIRVHRLVGRDLADQAGGKRIACVGGNVATAGLMPLMPMKLC